MKLKYLLLPFFILIAAGCESLRVHTSKKDWAGLEHWDANGNATLDLDEFVKGYSKKDFFDRWDTRSRKISDSVFLYQMFAFLDRNHNNVLDSAEYSSRRILWTFSGTKRLKKWDENKDKIIQRNEFMERARDENIAGAFDIIADGQITESEMAEGMFDVCDKDHDGTVSGMEFYLWEVYRR